MKTSAFIALSVKEPFHSNRLAQVTPSLHRTLLIHRPHRPLPTDSGLHQSGEGQMPTVGSWERRRYIHGQPYATPRLPRKQAFPVKRRAAAERAAHGHAAFISWQNHCYHGKKLLFLPLALTFGSPHKEGWTGHTRTRIS